MKTFVQKIAPFLTSGIESKISPFDKKPQAMDSFLHGFQKII